MRKLGVALAVLLCLLVGLVLSGCGGSSSDRPSVDTISKGLREPSASSTAKPFSKETADCIAKTIYSSGMSTAGIKMFLAGGQDFDDADRNAFRDILPDLGACNPVSPTGPSPTP